MSNKKRIFEAFGYEMLLPKKVVELVDNDFGVKLYQDPSFQTEVKAITWEQMKNHNKLFYLRVKAKNTPEGVIIPLSAEVLREQRRMRYSELMALLREDTKVNYLNDDKLRQSINQLQGYPISSTYKEQDHLFTYCEKQEEYAQDIQRWIKIVHENQNHPCQTQP